MSKTTRKRVDPNRWPGVYRYESSKRVYKGKPDICFYINYKIDGKITWEKIGWKSEKISPQVAAEIRAQRVRAARHGDDVKTQSEIRRERKVANITLDDLAEKYFLVRGGDEYSGRMDRLRYEKHVKPLLGKKPVQLISPMDLKQIELRMADKAPATVWGALELVRRFANFGVKNRLSKGLGFVVSMPALDNEVVEYLEPDDAERFLNVLEEWPIRDAPRMLIVAMFTGLRRKEIFTLEKRDVDFKQNLIILREPKGGKTVSVPLNPVVRDVVREQLADVEKRFPETPFVFPGKFGGGRISCSAVSRIKKKAELPKTFRIFHGLRHHFAVILANSGEFSLDMIGDLLTHKSHKMTKRYAQFLPDTKKKASNRAAELLMGR